MNIIGQGGKIMLFAVPAALAAVAIHVYAPAAAKLPVPRPILFSVGCLFLVVGFALWALAVVQLLIGFPKGKLIKTGAYRICRNPIYSSIALFVLPGISLVLGTWVYALVSVFLILAVVLFIRKEEQNLLKVFGEEYKTYLKLVSRILPLVKPAQ
jgi:protein-S-isoprenylcysteine O-methyltransferase Ste14